MTLGSQRSRFCWKKSSPRHRRRRSSSSAPSRTSRREPASLSDPIVPDRVSSLGDLNRGRDACVRVWARRAVGSHFCVRACVRAPARRDHVCVTARERSRGTTAGRGRRHRREETADRDINDVHEGSSFRRPCPTGRSRVISVYAPHTATDPSVKCHEMIIAASRSFGLPCIASCTVFYVCCTDLATGAPVIRDPVRSMPPSINVRAVPFTSPTSRDLESPSSYPRKGHA